MHIPQLFKQKLNCTTHSNVHSPSSEFWKERSEQSWLRFKLTLETCEKDFTALFIIRVTKY